MSINLICPVRSDMADEYAIQMGTVCARGEVYKRSDRKQSPALPHNAKRFRSCRTDMLAVLLLLLSRSESVHSYVALNVLWVLFDTWIHTHTHTMVA